MEIRREQPQDIPAIRSVVAAAFRGATHSAPPLEPGDDPGEATLVTWLRADAGWIPALSLVAVDGASVIGHVAVTRALVGEETALGLGPLSVRPERQRDGVGSALMHAVLGAAEALDEAAVGLLGDPAYYSRFGFVPAASIGIAAPEEAWGDYFQARPLTAYDGRSGPFRYAAPFDRVSTS